MLESSFDTCGMTCFDLRTLWEEKKNNNARVRVANVRVSIITWEGGSQRCKAQEKERKNEKKRKRTTIQGKKTAAAADRGNVYEALGVFSLSLCLSLLWYVSGVLPSFFARRRMLFFCLSDAQTTPFLFPSTTATAETQQIDKSCLSSIIEIRSLRTTTKAKKKIAYLSR